MGEQHASPTTHHPPPYGKYHPITSVLHVGKRDALLSRGVKKTDLNGFVNLVFIIFIITNFREFMANLLKYGLLVRLYPSPSLLWRNSLTIACLAMMMFLALTAYILERNRGALFAVSQGTRKMETNRIRESLGHVSDLPSPDSLARAKDRTVARCETALASDRLQEAGPTLMKGEVPLSQAMDDRMESVESAEQSQESVDGDTLQADTTSNKESPAVVNNMTDTTTAEAEDGAVGAKGSPPFVNADSISATQHAMEVLAEIAASHELLQKAAENAHVVSVVLICLSMIVGPYLVVTYSDIDEVSSFLILITSLTWTLKLISFHHVLRDVRLCLIEEKEKLFESCSSEAERDAAMRYPESLSWRSFCAFIAMPTICFQLHFPRKERVSWSTCFGYGLKLCFCLIAMKVLVEQYVAVIVQNTFHYAHNNQLSRSRLWLHFLERTLKLSVPTLYVWLLMFLAFFHFWFLLLAEITRFEDCAFYEDWWNATGFGEYWRKWNLPVHHFCIRHIYKPLLNRGTSRLVAGQVVFSLSALAHEYLVSAPLKVKWTGLVFAAFMMQTPLALITDGRLSKTYPQWGNVLFWIVFSFTGQPPQTNTHTHAFSPVRRHGILPPMDRADSVPRDCHGNGRCNCNEFQILALQRCDFRTFLHVNSGMLHLNILRQIIEKGRHRRPIFKATQKHIKFGCNRTKNKWPQLTPVLPHIW
eukprot:Blabericola_migrator_1__3903@NODE_217_length_11276_cov_60_022660_g184_i0_p2_GENE_NODE_217_length_11276_cov_60_022660_g184_i0NODE_217_length_11276_cov_60_022660_g184_i0_p2_ORF_typecomplete_len703_score111_16MBOAT/PF03062_19/1_6e03MBOAT/PF03062_19/2_7e43MBOAT_2/PF13813_6/2e05_NODE_217_length_11276_cov_60_022660_g184_i0875810866